MYKRGSWGKKKKHHKNPQIQVSEILQYFVFPFKGGTPTICQKKIFHEPFPGLFTVTRSASSSYTLNYCPHKTASSSVAWCTREHHKPQLTFQALRTFYSCDIPRLRAAHQPRFGEHSYPHVGICDTVPYGGGCGSTTSLSEGLYLLLKLAHP